MIEWALAGLREWAKTAHVVFVALHSARLEKYLTEALPGSLECGRMSVHFTKRSRGGELETILAARHAIVDLDAPLLIASSNVYVEWEPRISGHSAAVVVVGPEVTEAHKAHPASAYTRLGQSVEVSAEGRVLRIGDEPDSGGLEATGTYYFSSARDFLEAAEQLQKSNTRVGGEIRVSSVIDVFLGKKWRVDAATARQAWPLRSTWDVLLFENWGGAPGCLRRAGYSSPVRWIGGANDSDEVSEARSRQREGLRRSPQLTWDFREFKTPAASDGGE